MSAKTKNGDATLLYSPILRAVWGDASVDNFAGPQVVELNAAQEVLRNCIAIVQRHKQVGTLHDENQKVREEVLSELGGEGYWELFVPVEYGGSGASFATFVSMLTQMATVDPTIAGLAAVHSCIGAMGALRTFGSDEQKQRLLPGLASGRSLGVFALTEPNAGSDLTALRTTARLEGDHYVVNGEKVFITNLALGRTLALVCLIDGKPAVLIAELPRKEDATFQLREYGLWALKHTWNRGIEFRDFRVPGENLLVPPRGDGLTIAYHGLNLGRTALCANAAGNLRIMLAKMLPWAKFRETYGQPLANRELVQRRIGELASLIVGCDALAAWCAGLIDRGVRCEMECITAKVFASESLKHAAVELFLKTHGGRSFLHGNLLGDHLHDYLAPLIYEGEGEMLSLAFFKSLVKPRLKGIQLSTEHDTQKVDELMELKALGEEVDQAILKFGHELADRQCRMAEISQRCMDLATILVSTQYALRHESEFVRMAGEVLSQRLRTELSGARPSDEYYRQVTELGAKVSESGIPGGESVIPSKVLLPH